MLICYLNRRRWGAEGWEQTWDTGVQTVFRVSAPFTLFIALFSVLKPTFQGPPNFQNMWYFPFAVTYWFTCKKLSHTAHLYVNRYSLFTDCRFSSCKVRGTFLIFQWKAEDTFLVQASISDGSMTSRFCHNLEVRKAINLRDQKLFIYFKVLLWLFWTMADFD